MDKPSIYEFLDHREFLKSLQTYLQDLQGLSARGFGKLLGFGSPSYLKALYDKKRNLSTSNALKLARRLGMNRQEIQVFVTLVLFNNETKDLKKKDELFQSLIKYKKFRVARFEDAAEYHVFSNWHVPALLEGLQTDWAQCGESQWARDLGISDQELQSALKSLADLGFITKAEGRWKRLYPSHESPDETASLHIRNIHRQMIEKALAAVDGFENYERSLGSLTIAVSLENIERLKEKISKFRQDLNREFSGDKNPDKVMQINIQLFPLLALKKRGR